MIDYHTNVNWRQDRITQGFLERDYPFAVPESMTPEQLAETVTYIRGNHNPYAEELCRRAGTLDRYKQADSEQELYALVVRAAAAFDIILR